MINLESEFFLEHLTLRRLENREKFYCDEKLKHIKLQNYSDATISRQEEKNVQIQIMRYKKILSIMYNIDLK